ncbi:MAG: hypothetical protein P4L46_12765 [Fimbriimonas sp.]|nr:hypothetical protein [Fimbriimonas sp.]
MRKKLIGQAASLALCCCLCVAAAGQGKGGHAAPNFKAMRVQADANARALANTVQVHGVKAGTYNNVMTDYAKDLGGSLPINPCTGTRTGYTMTMSENRRSAIVCASAGMNCGKWSPRLYKLKL